MLVISRCVLTLCVRSTAVTAVTDAIALYAYNSIVIDYRKNELEEQMLMNLHRKQWTEGLVMKRFEDHQTSNEKTIEVQLLIYIHIEE
jgi:hypothetical protein